MLNMSMLLFCLFEKRMMLTQGFSFEYTRIEDKHFTVMMERPSKLITLKYISMIPHGGRLIVFSNTCMYLEENVNSQLSKTESVFCSVICLKTVPSYLLVVTYAGVSFFPALLDWCDVCLSDIQQYRSELLQLSVRYTH